MTILHARPKRWDRESYYKLVDSGALRADERVELIEGTIVALSPQNPPHSVVIGNLTMTLAVPLKGTHVVRVQCPFNLGEFSQPEPDVAVVSLDHMRGLQHHPSRAELIIEIADSSEAYDRQEKASLYAKFGVPELWVALVRSRAVEVCRDPQPDPTAPFGASYATRFQLSEEALLTPLFAPTLQIPVSEVFAS